MAHKHRTKSPDPGTPSLPLPEPAGAGGTGAIVTSHMRLLFLHRSTCSGEMTLPVKGPISVPALIQVLEKMPSPSPGMELWAMITSDGSTRLDSFCTSAGGGRRFGKGTRRRPPPTAALPLHCPHRRGRAGVPGEGGRRGPLAGPSPNPGAEPFKRPTGLLQSGTRFPPGH